MKRTIIIDTDNETIELLHEHYNIIETTFYGKGLNKKAKEILTEMVLYNVPF